MIQTYNAMLIERWIIKAPQKIIPPLRNSESKAPQKILMIRFETKTWLMENQVKLSCFSPVSVHLEIWLQLFWCLLDQNQWDLIRGGLSDLGALSKFQVWGPNTITMCSFMPNPYFARSLSWIIVYLSLHNQ